MLVRGEEKSSHWKWEREKTGGGSQGEARCEGKKWKSAWRSGLIWHVNPRGIRSHGQTVWMEVNNPKVKREAMGWKDSSERLAPSWCSLHQTINLAIRDHLSLLNLGSRIWWRWLDDLPCCALWISTLLRAFPSFLHTTCSLCFQKNRTKRSSWNRKRDGWWNLEETCFAMRFVFAFSSFGFPGLLFSPSHRKAEGGVMRQEEQRQVERNRRKPRRRRREVRESAQHGDALHSKDQDDSLAWLCTLGPRDVSFLDSLPSTPPFTPLFGEQIVAEEKSPKRLGRIGMGNIFSSVLRCPSRAFSDFHCSFSFYVCFALWPVIGLEMTAFVIIFAIVTTAEWT